MKLFFDLETTGLPKQIDFDTWYPPKDVEKYNESRIIEIGILLVHKGKIIETYNSLVKPENFISLKPIITKITGITDEDILNEGKGLSEVINDIQPILDKATVINSYNINFDYNILLSELYRKEDKITIKKLMDKNKECTLKLATKYLGREKYPKLEYVYKVLFNEDPKQDHRAFGDAILCKDVYYKIRDSLKVKSI